MQTQIVLKNLGMENANLNLNEIIFFDELWFPSLKHILIKKQETCSADQQNCIESDIVCGFQRV